MRARAIWTAAAATLLSSAAAGYVLGSTSVFKRFAEKQAADPSAPATLAGRAVIADTAAGGRETEAPVRLELGPGTCRAVLEQPGGDLVASLERGRLSGGASAALDAFVALGCPFTTVRGVSAAEAEARVTRAATALGADLSVVSLSRLGRRACWVVGATPQAGERPQIWFDKELSRPLRVVGRVGDRLWDVRFQDPAALATGQAHPRIAEVWQGREKLLSMRLMTAGTEQRAGLAGGEEMAVEEPE